MQMISKHAGMLELFDRKRNHTDPAQISVKTDNKYWFTIEGHSLLVSPRTVLRHFELNTPWNFGRLGQTYAHDDYGLDDYYDSASDFAKRHGIPQQTVSRLMAQGYTYEDIEQGKHLKVVDHLGNRYKSKAAMAKAYGISKFVFDKREKAGWSLEKALTTPTDTSKQPIGRMKQTGNDPS